MSYDPIENRHSVDEDSSDLELTSYDDKSKQPHSASWISLDSKYPCLVVVAFCFTALIIGSAVLLLELRTSSKMESSIETPVPKFSQKVVSFMNDPRYMDIRIFSNLTYLESNMNEWHELMTSGHGDIKIDQPDKYNLGRPWTMTVGSEPREFYVLSAFHQLHCLRSLLELYSNMVQGINLDPTHEHAFHCFEYLRQAIMCSADLTVEGYSASGPGWGSSHICKDFESIRKWAIQNSAFN